MQCKDEQVKVIKAFLDENSFIYKHKESKEVCIDIGKFIQWCEENEIQVENVVVENTDKKGKPLRIRDVEERYEISRNTAASIFRADDSPAYLVGAQWFIEEKDLISYLKRKTGKKEEIKIDIT